MLKKVREFFEMRQVLEVDVPLLSKTASIDEHIDLIQLSCCGKRGYLHSSPEYGMKRLLAEGIEDIYQLSHVFRNEEVGERHQPEFMMAEWYRIGFSLEEMIEETLAFISLFLDQPLDEILTYDEAFLKYANVSWEEVSDRDHHFAFHVEPKLGQRGFAVLKEYPAADAALAQTRWNGEKEVAMRFEVLYKGVELANGYLELTDPQEQKRRLFEANRRREKLGKESYPLDTAFLKALETGIPDCMGVAVGIDRLMMLRHGCDHIDEVIPFAW